MADHDEIARQSNQEPTRIQRKAVAVRVGFGTLSTWMVGTKLGALPTVQHSLHYILKPNNNWEPAGVSCLAGSGI